MRLNNGRCQPTHPENTGREHSLLGLVIDLKSVKVRLRVTDTVVDLGGTTTRNVLAFHGGLAITGGGVVDRVFDDSFGNDLLRTAVVIALVAALTEAGGDTHPFLTAMSSVASLARARLFVLMVQR